MANTQLKQEDYAAIADFMLQSFERDKAEFLKHYKAMDDAFLADFKAANQALKTAPSVMTRVKQQQSVTLSLHHLLDETKRNVIFLNDYAKRAKLDVASLTKVVKQAVSRNAEGVVKTLRDALPYYEEHKREITNMPEGFLDSIKEQVAQIEALNADQDKSMNVKKSVTGANKTHYKNLYNYMAEVAKAGKLIYKGTPKVDEYTIQKVLSRVRVAKKAVAANAGTNTAENKI